jgi:hypothetical protein
MKSKLAVSLATVLVLSGCVEAPMGPTVAVMPGPNKPFDAFQSDQALCRQFAEQQVGGAQQAQQTGTNQALVDTGIGAVLGAGAGALLGGGRGAAIGAGVGGLGGAAVGTSQAAGTQMSVQRRYDIAYEQCMYSRGNQVPGYVQPAASPAPPPPPPPGYPPPPPGYYPPPPPPGYR